MFFLNLKEKRVVRNRVRKPIDKAKQLITMKYIITSKGFTKHSFKRNFSKTSVEKQEFHNSLGIQL